MADSTQARALAQTNATFGTPVVFLTAISTILGAILFLRFGYAVAHVGFWGVVAIVLVGHLVTLATALAISEIATNQRVEGGGEYFIISRSFGPTIGASIGISLYVSQAVSVAFYIIAFAEAFAPVFTWLEQSQGWQVIDKRWVSLPAVVLLSALILWRGSSLGVKALYVVVAALFASIGMFLVGHGNLDPAAQAGALEAKLAGGDPFAKVFAICFPAFTGMTAGVGLSGNLANPRRSIPLGTMSATLFGLVVYIAVAYKLATSMPTQALANDPLVMSSVVAWAPIIPIGLACATISSALGSFMVAPRTLQAMARDRVFPSEGANRWLEAGHGEAAEPRRATWLTAVIACVFVGLGDVDFVAQLISMFFMVTYGSLCTIAFLEYFAADPAYRPTFRSRWYISLIGAIACAWLMFEMSAVFATTALVCMLALYLALRQTRGDEGGLSRITQGVVFQLSRRLHIFLQKNREPNEEAWRPSFVCISNASFHRHGAFEMLRWLSHRYGFGSYLHWIPGYLSRETHQQSAATLQRLLRMADVSRSNVYVDTVVSPSYTSAIAQLVQIPGIAGKENNMALFEYDRGAPEGLEEIIANYPLVLANGFDVCILASCDRGFGYRTQIHVWLRPGDFENANLMILLAYMLLGHQEWEDATIHVFSLVPVQRKDQEKENLARLIREGRLPISAKHVKLVIQDKKTSDRSLIAEFSREADLVILGFRSELLRHQKETMFAGYDDLGATLFVNTTKDITLVEPEADTPERPPLSETNPAELPEEIAASKVECETNVEREPQVAKPDDDANLEL